MKAPFRIALFFSLVLLALPGLAQYNRYYLERLNEPYADLTGDTALDAGNFGTGDLFLFPVVGDTFRFFNRDYPLNTSTVVLAFSTNGHIHIEDPSRFIIVDGLFYWMDSVSATSSISYKVEGSGQNKILKAQWKNLKVRSGPAGNWINMQIWLFKATGMVELRYGPSSANNASGYNNQSGPNVGLFFSNKDFTSMYEKIWINGLPNQNRVDSARNLVFNGMHGVPPDGTVYRFAVKPGLTALEGPREEQGLLSVYPNPALDRITVSLHGGHPATLTLADAQGKHVYQKQTNGAVSVLPTADLPPGLYMLRIATVNKMYTRRVAIAH